MPGEEGEASRAGRSPYVVKHCIHLLDCIGIPGSLGHVPQERVP